jgi:hypothetical protein
LRTLQPSSPQCFIPKTTPSPIRNLPKHGPGTDHSLKFHVIQLDQVGSSRRCSRSPTRHWPSVFSMIFLKTKILLGEPPKKKTWRFSKNTTI